MKKTKQVLVILSMIIGSTGGLLLSSSTTQASAPCEDLSCRDDKLGGDRCFSVQDADGYNCDDSGYPTDCYMTLCNQPH